MPGTQGLRGFFAVLPRSLPFPADPFAPTALLPQDSAHFQNPAGKPGVKILLNVNYTSKRLAVRGPSEIVLIEVPWILASSDGVHL